MEQNVQELWEKYKNVTCMYYQKEMKKMFEVIMTKNFSKLMSDTKPRSRKPESQKRLYIGI